MNGSEETCSERIRRPASFRKYLVLLLVGLLAAWGATTLRGVRSPAKSAARALGSNDPTKRIVAIADLERFGQEEPAVALAALRSSLNDNVPDVRAAASLATVRVISAAGTGNVALDEVKITMGALFRALADNDATVREAALRSLWLVGSLWNGDPRLVDLSKIQNALIAGYKSPEATIRLTAVRGLGAISPKLGQEPPPALSAALDDSSSEVRTAAAEAHPWFSASVTRWLPGFVAAFEKAKRESRPARALVFSQIRPGMFKTDVFDPLAKALSSSDPEVRTLAASALRKFGDNAAQHNFVNAPFSAIPALVRAIAVSAPPHGDTKTPTNRARLYIEPNKQFDWEEGGESEPAGDPAVGALRALHMMLPWYAFDGPRPKIDPESFATLSELLKSGSPQIRAGVALCLGRFKPEDSLVALLNQAIGDNDPLVRAAALRGLHDLADTLPFAPSEIFHKALEDPAPEVRYWAAGALGHIQRGLDPFVTALLQHAEQDPDNDVRDVCITEVESIIRADAVSKEVVPTLIQGLSSSSPRVRFAACGLLGRLGPTAAAAIPKLIDLVKEPSPAAGSPTKLNWEQDQQCCALEALGRIAPKTTEADRVGTFVLEAIDYPLSARAKNQCVRVLVEFPSQGRAALSKLRDLSQSAEQALRESAEFAISRIEPAS